MLVPLYWRLAEEEWRFIVAGSESCCLCSDEQFETAAGRLARTYDIPDLTLDDRLTLPGGEGSSLKAYIPEPDTVIFQVYTSGITGEER